MKHRIKRYGQLSASLISGIFMVVAWIIGTTNADVSIFLYVLAYIIGGFSQAIEGLRTLVKEKDIDVNLLMIFAAIGAASIGYWTEGALLIFIFSLSGALETYTMNRSSKDISALIDLKPETALLVSDGVERVVSIDDLQVGDLIVVKPGEIIAADGKVDGGFSSVDQSSITGESVPVEKVVNDEVFAGTLNGEGVLYIEVTKSSESTLFAKIVKLVQEAQSEKPASQTFMEKFERIYARLIVLITLLLIIVPPLFGWLSFKETFYKAMVFMVVASPCALVASIMPAILSAISTSARRGILMKGGAHLENLGRVRAVAFDKTGTLTAGRPAVTNIISYNGKTEEDILLYAAAMESLSNHPLAKAIVELAEQQNLNYAAVPLRHFQAITGYGLQATIDDKLLKIGKPQLAQHLLTDVTITDDVKRLESEGKTVTLLMTEDKIIGLIALKDTVREEAKRAVTRLKQLGIHVVMLSGDQPQTALAIADQLQLDHRNVYAGLLPGDKVEQIKQLREQYGAVAMVGDGVNDAPALATATVGIAMGNTGSGAALETADIVLMNDDIGKIAASISLGKRTSTIIKQNIVFALLIIIILITANFFDRMTLPLGVIGHEGSTILVILNGLRLLFDRH
ncbi:heavy metal translocating P-type ATPase [Paenibacillus yanchengensis]|uniref:Heavy metal translocating P-type ATPase n=1 Tax=Paenibacillus yanchengensis TaxID=2035833 RepID=A0ABW4YPX4_9BACL